MSFGSSKKCFHKIYIYRIPPTLVLARVIMSVLPNVIKTRFAFFLSWFPETTDCRFLWPCPRSGCDDHSRHTVPDTIVLTVYQTPGPVSRRTQRTATRGKRTLLVGRHTNANVNAISTHARLRAVKNSSIVRANVNIGRSRVHVAVICVGSSRGFFEFSAASTRCNFIGANKRGKGP